MSVEEIVNKLESKKKNYYNCYSSKEAKLISQWNKAVEECINTIIDMYKTQTK